MPRKRKAADERVDSKGKKQNLGASSTPAKRTRTGNQPTGPNTLQTTRPTRLFIWGSNGGGQLGLGSFSGTILKPRRHPWAEQQAEQGGFGEQGAGLVGIAAGGGHTLLLDETGTVWSCGLNDDAALGRITEDIPDPSNPDSFLDQDVLEREFHKVDSLIAEDFRSVQVAAGGCISAAVSDQGDLRVWGTFRDDQGRYLFADKKSHQFLPTPILRLTRNTGKVSSIACGANHIVVLTTLGNVYTWGLSELGRLGRKVSTFKSAPDRVLLGDGSRKAVVIGAGETTSFAVDDSGDVWGWGLNSMGHTGTGHPKHDKDVVERPSKVIGLSSTELDSSDRVVKIAGGEHHTLFLTSQGKVYVCGKSNDGQLGLVNNHDAEDHRTTRFVSEPVRIDFPSNADDDPIVHISAGLRYNMAVTRDGILYSWGFGPQGELGLSQPSPDDEIELALTPQPVTRREGSWAVKDVSCGGMHVLGLFQKRQ